MKVIHIKKSAGTERRRIAAEPYQEVCTQVVKNLTSVTRSRLITDLQARFESEAAGPLWHDGARTNDMDGFLTELAAPRASEKYLAVIVQPHVSDRLLAAARGKAASGLGGDGARLRRLEHLLAATDNVLTRVSGRLQVIAKLEPPLA